MPSPSIHAAPVPARMLPAWAISFLLHVSMMVLLCWELQYAPRGAAEEQGGSAGIVLKHTSAEGNLDESAEVANQSVAVVDDLPQPPELLAPSPNESVTADVGSDITQVAMAAPDAADDDGKPAAQQTKSNGGKANARPSTSGVGRRGSPDGSGYAQVSVFGVQGKGSKFVYLFDRSSSMEGPPLTAAKRQLLESLQSLDTVHQFHIIFFNTKTQAFDITGGGRRIAFATDRNKKLAANFVGGIMADGGTDRLVALREAISFAPDVIFFLTDADDPMPASEMAEIARANKRIQAAICVIEFGRKPAPLPDNFLARLARESGGQYGFVDTTKLTK